MRMIPAIETSASNPLYGPSPMRAIAAARCPRMVTKTWAPMKATSPATRIARPMNSPPQRGNGVEAIVGPEASGRAWTWAAEGAAMRPLALALLAAWLALGAVPTQVWARQDAPSQQWPNKSVKIVVPFGAGSTPDIVARLIADRLAHKLGQTFVIENKPGASGNLGTDAVAKAEPDGATIGVSIGGPLAINTLLFPSLPYDPKTDIAAVTQLVTMPSVLAVNPGLGVNSVADLVALLKREPGKYDFGSIGNGSLSHLSMEAIALKSGTQIVHVPFTGSPQAMTAVMRNDVQMACLPAASVV